MSNAPKLIGEFFSGLADDPDKLNAYLENPNEVMAAYGLNETQRGLVLSNDLASLREKIREEYQNAQVLLFPFPVQHILAPQNVISPGDED